jgi:hypothetical protein
LSVTVSDLWIPTHTININIRVEVRVFEWVNTKSTNC